MKRILHVIPSAEIAGVETFTLRLASAQAAAGGSSVAVLSARGPAADRYRRAGLDCIEMDERSPGFIAMARAVAGARTALGEQDIVHVHSVAEHCRAARRSFPGAGVVFRCSGNVGIGFWFAARAINRWADIGVANSTEDFRAFARFGARAEKMRLIHNGSPALASTEKGRRALAQRLGLDTGRDFVVVSLARLARAKGLDTLVEAAARLDAEAARLRLVVAGDGPERGKLEQRAADLGLSDRVHFPGLIENVGDLLALADVYAHPSRHEPFSNAVLEAMSMGCPVLGTAVGGTKDQVIDGETGLLVPPNDADALAAAMARLAADAELRRKLGAAGRDRHRARYSMSSMVAQFDDAYTEASKRAAERR